MKNLKCPKCHGEMRKFSDEIMECEHCRILHSIQFVKNYWMGFRAKAIQDQDDIKFLLSLVPDWAKIVPEGLEPTMYGTLTYEGDLEVKKRVDKIRQRLKEGRDD